MSAPRRRPPLAPLIAVIVTGCLAVPIPLDKTRGRAIDTEQSAAIQIGSVTREEVVARLGEPDAIWVHERIFAYSWDRINVGAVGFILYGPPFYAEFPTHHMLLIQFDETDRVKRMGHRERSAFTSYGQLLKRWAAEKSDGDQ